MKDSSVYRIRLLDEKITNLMKVFGAVNIVGAKACGKTSSAEHHCVEKVCIASADGEYASRTLAQINPALVLEGRQRPLLIDEWQELPQIWDAVRFACDDCKQPGQFLLTGSSVTRGMIHSGAGRIVDIRMLTMSLLEMGLTSGQTVSLKALFDREGNIAPVVTGEVTVHDLIRIIGQGGWPLLVGLDREAIAGSGQSIALGYLNAVVERDFKKVTGFKRTPKKEMVQGLLKALAANDAMPANQSDLVQKCQKLSGARISVNTVPVYLEAFRDLYLIEDQEAFVSPAGISRVPLTSPKVRFVDPSLIPAALGIEPEFMLRDIPTLETAFDNLCVHELKVYAETDDGKVMHYRDNYGTTADSVVRMKDGRWCAFDHVLGAHQVDAAADKLLKLKKSFAGSSDPCSFVGVICGTANAAYTRPDGVVVLPVTALVP